MKYHISTGVLRSFIRTNSKLIVLAIAGLFLFSYAVMTLTARAEINAVTPSTNNDNITNGWAHVNATPTTTDISLEFVSTRNFWSCFEYRTDGDTSQSTGDNYNPGVTDGLYPFTCVNNSTELVVVAPTQYVEVRMVFGAETDERFDWTRFDLFYERSAEITAPAENTFVSGSVNFTAYLNDDNADNIQWAIRQGTCAAGTNTVFGNVDGKSDVATINQSVLSTQTFAFTADMTSLTDGMYCFIYNPVEDSGESNIRLTREFTLDNTKPDVLSGLTIKQNNVNIGCNAYVSNRTITVDWNDSTDPNFAYYGYQADDGIGGIDFTTTVNMSSRTGNIRDLDGTYMYRVRAVDTAGNVGDWSNWCMITLDRLAPIVTVELPLDGDVLGGIVEVYGTVADDNLSHYNASIYPSTTDLSDGGTHSADRLVDSGVVITDEFSNQVVLNFDTSLLPDGDYQIRLAARDLAGNRDLSDPYNGGTSSVHVISVSVLNEPEGEGGNVQGAFTYKDVANEQEPNGVLAATTSTEQSAVLADTDTLSVTGNSALLYIFSGLIIAAIPAASYVAIRKNS